MLDPTSIFLLMTIHQITFSPTGGTRRVSELLCKGLGGASTYTELCTKHQDLKLPHIAQDDLVVISMPVFAGRVPALAIERLQAIEAHHALCVIVAVYEQSFRGCFGRNARHDYFLRF